MCSQSAVILLMSPTAPCSVGSVGGKVLTLGMQRLTGGVGRDGRKKRLRLPPSSWELLSSPSVLTKLFALDICRKTARTRMMERAVRALADTFLCRLMACILRPLHASARSAQSSQSELRWVDTSSQQPQVLGSPPKSSAERLHKACIPGHPHGERVLH